jgi:hypothetical protein
MTLFEKMNKGPQIVESGLHEIQTVLSKAMVPIVSMISGIGDGALSDKPMHENLIPLTDVVRLCFAAL